MAPFSRIAAKNLVSGVKQGWVRICSPPAYSLEALGGVLSLSLSFVICKIGNVNGSHLTGQM